MFTANFEKKNQSKILITINQFYNLNFSLVTKKPFIKDDIRINLTCFIFALLDTLSLPKKIDKQKLINIKVIYYELLSYNKYIIYQLLINNEQII